MSQPGKWRAYFSTPFPSRQGFSAYRQPGPMVHLPIAALLLLLGVYLCGGSVWLWPLLLFYALAGLYLGRDLAIQAHYGCPFLPVLLLFAFGLLVWGVPYLVKHFPLSPPSLWGSFLLSISAFRARLGAAYIPVSLGAAALLALLWRWEIKSFLPGD